MNDALADATDAVTDRSGPLYLRPRLAAPTRELLDSPALLHSLVQALRSPLHVVLPDRIAENAARFRAVFRKHRLGGRVLFAHKASASSALLRRLAATDADADVASLDELRHALASGFTPDRITATGPKDPEFLWLAALVGTTVAVDTTGELDALADLIRARGLPRRRVLLRLSGFESTGIRVLSRPSRFGTPVRDLDQALDRVVRHRDAVELTGVAYHLDTTGLTEKATALEGCLTVLGLCRDRGLSPRVVDVGGGFGISYLAERAQWERYTSALSDAVLGTRPPMTWNNHGYGLRDDKGVLRGALGVYPSHRAAAGEEYLDELLSMPAAAHGGRPLATAVLEQLYDMHAEPGRALLDQCGVTLATVLEVRPAPDGGAGLWVRIAAKADDIALEAHGVLMDPVLVPRAGPPAADGPRPVAVHLFGRLCLESDLITRRVVHLPRTPRAGDLLAFPNTAAYCMDFHATRAQRHPAAAKVAAWRSDGSWQWCLDEAYWPIDRQGEPS